jgi:DNA polymerase III subunit alpha
LKISYICLLAEVLDKLVKEVSLQLELETVDEEKVEKLFKLLKKHKGNCRVLFRVFDPDEKLAINLNATKFKVDCNDLIREISGIKGINYKLN